MHAPTATATQTRPPAGVRRGAADPDVDRVLVMLSDLVLSTGAIDGAVASCAGPDLRVRGSVGSGFSRRTLCRWACPDLGAAVDAGGLRWLEPGAAAQLYLPQHVQVLFIPVRRGGLTGAALLTFHDRTAFSDADRRFLQRQFAPAGRDLAVLPGAALTDALPLAA